MMARSKMAAKGPLYLFSNFQIFSHVLFPPLCTGAPLTQAYISVHCPVRDHVIFQKTNLEKPSLNRTRATSNKFKTDLTSCGLIFKLTPEAKFAIAFAWWIKFKIANTLIVCQIFFASLLTCSVNNHQTPQLEPHLVVQGKNRDDMKEAAAG